MPKPSLAADQLPASAAKALRDLGENLALARQRRKESLRAWASRMAVSVPTLIRMEKGDPSVGMGVYATALWLMGRHAALPEHPDLPVRRQAFALPVGAYKLRTSKLGIDFSSQRAYYYVCLLVLLVTVLGGVLNIVDRIRGWSDRAKTEDEKQTAEQRKANGGKLPRRPRHERFPYYLDYVRRYLLDVVKVPAPRFGS